MNPSTIKRDLEIWRLWQDGMHPKAIVSDLNVSSVDVVYKAIRRQRMLAVGKPAYAKGRVPKNSKNFR